MHPFNWAAWRRTIRHWWNYRPTLKQIKKSNWLRLISNLNLCGVICQLEGLLQSSATNWLSITGWTVRPLTLYCGQKTNTVGRLCAPANNTTLTSFQVFGTYKLFQLTEPDGYCVLAATLSTVHICVVTKPPSSRLKTTHTQALAITIVGYNVEAFHSPWFMRKGRFCFFGHYITAAAGAKYHVSASDANNDQYGVGQLAAWDSNSTGHHGTIQSALHGSRWNKDM